MTTRLMIIWGFCLLFSACEHSASNYSVEIINRNSVSGFKKNDNPYLLTVKIEKSGKLKLNRIETGSISDLSELSEKINVIFADRQRNGNFYKEVIIDADNAVEKKDLEELIECLKEAKAAPIRLIKDD